MNLQPIIRAAVCVAFGAALIAGAVSVALNRKAKSPRAVSSFIQSLFAVMLLGCAATSARAQAPEVFVSARAGADAGNCAVASPCRTVNFALTQVTAGGQVLIVDSGNYDSSITITKNVTIAAAPGVAAVFSAAANNGSIIRFSYDRSSCAAVGECHTLTLRNLIFDGRDVTQDAVRAAEIRLLAEDCTFTRFRFGVLVIGSGQYQFKNCIFQSLETGLKFAPSADGTIVRSPTLAVVEDCRFADLSWAGIEMYTGPLGNHTLRAVVRNSLFNRSEVGVISDASTGGSINVDLEGCEITNSLAGVVSAYADSTVRVSNSIITGNGTGLSADYGGQLLSRRNNTVENNTINGSFTGFFAAK